MSLRNLGTDLTDSLKNNEAFNYAHLVKFEKPISLGTRQKPFKNAYTYTYITDGAYDVIYDDGSKEFREWTITKEGENFYTGFADGVIGKASGSTSGNAFNWKYTFDLPIGSKKIKVNFDDWMFLQDKN